MDEAPALIVSCLADPVRLYAYAGIDFQGSYQQRAVGDALCDRIRNAFTSGHKEACRTCRSLETDLIREHVILGAPLEPYFQVLSHLRDALRARQEAAGEILGDWAAAVTAARDHIELSSYRAPCDSRVFAREFAVAEAAKFLKQQGYGIYLQPGFIALDEISEDALVAEIEKLVVQLGGLNVARKIFTEISQTYEPYLERYLIVPQISMTGGGHPQVPWGYLIQLAAKHIDGRKPYLDIRTHWSKLLTLITAYATIIDVQPYTSSAFGTFDAKDLLKLLQEQALYDSIFRFVQLRASDVLKICRGALDFIDDRAQTPGGWTLNEAFDVIGFFVDPKRDIRGPLIVAESEIRQAVPHIKKEAISTLLKDVFSHPAGGPNKCFSHPTDAPTPLDRSKGADFYLKPLIRRPGNRYLMLDRSACGWGFIEALLTALRPCDSQFEKNVGFAIEDFLEAEFVSHGVPVVRGEYQLTGASGECDLVAITPKTLIFMELKKKSLTRRAKAGSDADLLLDIAGSLLAAQAQAGWHELRIKNEGSLNLVRKGVTHSLSLGTRDVEKVAVGMMDFGGFQDRIMLKHFLEATLNANFGSHDPSYAARFNAINDSLEQIREQFATAHQGETEIRLPFFNCWFISVPQLLILLDKVNDANSFRDALWNCRHLTTGTSDLYFEISHIRKLKAASAASQ